MILWHNEIKTPHGTGRLQLLNRLGKALVSGVYLKHGYALPKGWGIAYPRVDHDDYVVYPIPLNLVVRWSRAFYFSLARGLSPTWEDRKIAEIRDAVYDSMAGSGGTTVDLIRKFRLYEKLTREKREKEEREMNMEEKLEAVRQLVSDHNRTLKGLGVTEFDPAEVVRRLKLAGGTSDERLAKFSYEEILACFGASPEGVAPVAVAKEIAAIFRLQDEPASRSRPPSSWRVERMRLGELVAAFDPAEAESPVGKRLKEISRGEPFVVYGAGGGPLDYDATVLLLGEVRAGYPGRSDYTAAPGDVRRVYRVGEIPDRFADENPLYPGRALRPDGTCDQTARSWAGVPREVRQLLRLALNVEGGGIPLSLALAHQMIDLALQPDALAALRQRFRKAAVAFDQMEKTGTLPSLTVKLGWKDSPPAGQKVQWQR